MKFEGLFQRKDTGTWYYQPPQVNGVRPRPESLHTKDRLEAIERWKQRSKLRKHQLTSERGSFELARYLAAKQTARTHTRASTEIAGLSVRRFLEVVGDRLVTDFTAQDVERFRDQLWNEGCSDATVQTYLSRLKAWFEWLKKAKLVDGNPVVGVEIPPERRTRANLYCKKAERDRLLSAVEHREDLAFVVWTGFMAGLRKREIIEARPEWFDLEAGVMHIQETPTFRPKGRHVRAIELSDRYLEFLRRYGLRGPFMVRPEVKHGRSRYRWDFRRPFGDFMEQQGMGWVTAHVMRRTFATLQVMAGQQIPLVAKWLGDDPQITFNHYFGYARNTGGASAAD